MGTLLYGGGLRIMEMVRMRLKDVDFDYRRLCVRDGKGSKDRFTILPDCVEDALREQIRRVLDLHQADLKAGFGTVYLPHALARKYPSADVRTTMIYTHVLPNGPLGVASPADSPAGGTDVALMLRQVLVLMQKLAPLAAALPPQPSEARTPQCLVGRQAVLATPPLMALTPSVAGKTPSVPGGSPYVVPTDGIRSCRPTDNARPGAGSREMCAA